jgi:hypothetical protein
MNVLICGGRDFNDWDTFRNEMFKIAEREFPRLQPDRYGNYLYEVKIIAGGAKGADSLAADWAAAEWTDYKEYPADWEKHGKAAGIIRNQQMLDEGKPDLVIAFPGGKGTADMVNRAKKAGVRVIEVGA